MNPIEAALSWRQFFSFVLPGFPAWFSRQAGKTLISQLMFG